MNEYRATINISECQRGKTAMFPDTPRTASLVADGILVPVVREVVDPPPDAPHFKTWAEGDWAAALDGTLAVETPSSVPPGKRGKGRKPPLDQI